MARRARLAQEVRRVPAEMQGAQEVRRVLAEMRGAQEVRLVLAESPVQEDWAAEQGERALRGTLAAALPAPEAQQGRPEPHAEAREEARQQAGCKYSPVRSRSPPRAT